MRFTVCMLLTLWLLTGCKPHETTLDHLHTPLQSASASSEPNELAAEPLVTSKKAVGHRDFSHAKKILPTIFSGMETDFYCGCHYQQRTIDWDSCGYVPRKQAKRAKHMEWEHVVPAWVLGHQRQCWKNGGRKSCEKTDPLFNMAEGDLNNLVPVVGEVNADRNNFDYGAWDKHPQLQYGQCQSVTDFKHRRFQPRPEVRGAAARITLYMYDRYQLHASPAQHKLMCAWARENPISDWETKRNQRIIQWQGSGNFLIDQPDRLNVLCPR